MAGDVSHHKTATRLLLLIATVCADGGPDFRMQETWSTNSVVVHGTCERGDGQDLEEQVAAAAVAVLRKRTHCSGVWRRWTGTLSTHKNAILVQMP